MPTIAEPLKAKPRLLRGPIVRAPSANVDRTGGKYGAGKISNVSVITKGEASGHGMWIDDEMLSQVEQAFGADGVKSRFAHPGLSGDGIGKALGRAYGSAVVDGRVVSDLHLFQAAHESPDGDLAEYVMNLASEDPGGFGMSIAYEPDIGAEDRFFSENEDERGGFVSPDPDNTQNLPHARLARLYAVDVVDEPAANPNGLFHRTSIPADAEAVVAYALGVGGHPGDELSLGVDPDRVRGFVQRFLDAHGLQLIYKEQLGRMTERMAKVLDLLRD
jgi:hypothetical protein